MATKANWTIVFEDKKVIKNHAEGASQGVGYIISINLIKIIERTPDVTDFICGYMSIYLSGSRIFMTQDLLDVSKVCSLLQ